MAGLAARAPVPPSTTSSAVDAPSVRAPPVSPLCISLVLVTADSVLATARSAACGAPLPGAAGESSAHSAAGRKSLSSPPARFTRREPLSSPVASQPLSSVVEKGPWSPPRSSRYTHSTGSSSHSAPSSSGAAPSMGASLKPFQPSANAISSRFPVAPSNLGGHSSGQC